MSGTIRSYLLRGPNEALLFTNEHIYNLPPASYQVRKSSLFDVNDRANFRSNGFGEVRKNRSVKSVGLCESACGFSKITNVTWIDDRNRQRCFG